jgi:hypothetical protein
MIHGTKMILVPQELAKALNGDLPQAPAPAGSYSAMDAEMRDILKSKNSDDFTKWKQYNNVLQRYMAKIERTKHSLTVNIEDDDHDDDDDDDGGAQQPPPPPPTPTKKVKKIKNKPDSNQTDEDEDTKAPAKRANRAIKAPILGSPNNKTNKKAASLTPSNTTLPEILKSLANIKEKKQARELFNALEESKQVIVTKTGMLKIKRKNVGFLEPLIRYKIKGEPGKSPAGWDEFSGFIGTLKAVTTHKPVSAVPSARRGANKLVGNGKSWLKF